MFVYFVLKLLRKLLDINLDTWIKELYVQYRTRIGLIE